MALRNYCMPKRNQLIHIMAHRNHIKLHYPTMHKPRFLNEKSGFVFCSWVRISLYFTTRDKFACPPTGGNLRPPVTVRQPAEIPVEPADMSPTNYLLFCISSQMNIRPLAVFSAFSRLIASDFVINSSA